MMLATASQSSSSPETVYHWNYFSPFLVVLKVLSNNFYCLFLIYLFQKFCFDFLLWQMKFNSLTPSTSLTPHFFSPLHSKSYITVFGYSSNQRLYYFDYVNDVYQRVKKCAMITFSFILFFNVFIQHFRGVGEIPFSFAQSPRTVLSCSDTQSNAPRHPVLTLLSASGNLLIRVSYQLAAGAQLPP